MMEVYIIGRSGRYGGSTRMGVTDGSGWSSAGGARVEGRELVGG